MFDSWFGDLRMFESERSGHRVSCLQECLRTYTQRFLCKPFVPHRLCIHDQVRGVLTMLQNHSAGNATEPKLLASAGAFFAECHSRMVWFAATTKDGQDDGEMDQDTKFVRVGGKAALNYRFAQAVRTQKRGEVLEFRDLELLRLYRDFLTEAQCEQVDLWLSQRIQAALMNYKRIGDAPPEQSEAADAETAIVMSTSGASSSSKATPSVGSARRRSSMGSSASCATKPDTKSIGTETRDKLMTFFSKKQG